MTNKIPIIKVKQEIKKIGNINPLIRDTVCIIGGFETTTNNLVPTNVTTIQEAREIYGTDTTIDANAVLEKILGDNTVSNVLIVNITTSSGTGAETTYSRTVTQSKLESAVEALDLIKFDILYTVVEPTDALLKVITDFADDRFENKMPFGYVAAFTRANNSAYETTAGKLGDFCYSAVIQRLEVDDTELSLLETGAFITKQIATMNVGESLTAKVIPEVTGIKDADILTFGTGSDGETLTGYGYLLFRLINPTTNTYEAVNSANPNGLDVYMSRVRDYIVNEFALREFLGEKGNTKTLELIKSECNRIYTKFKELDLIEAMNFSVVKKDAETVNVIINSIQFAGVITEIDVFITIEVV